MVKKLLTWMQWLPIIGIIFVGICCFRGHSNMLGRGVAYGGEQSYGFASNLYQVTMMVLIIFLIAVMKGY